VPDIHSPQKLRSRLAINGGVLACVSLVFMILGGCTLQVYEPKPLEPYRVIETLQSRNLSDPGLREFLREHGIEAETWPLAAWDLPALTLLALYYNPDLAVARAQWEVSRTHEETAGQLLNPGISFDPERHSEKEDYSSSLWTWSLRFDFSLELPSKRAARVDRAQAFTEAARLDIAAAAWRVRSRLREGLVELHAAMAGTELLTRELEVIENNVALLAKRYELGEASRYETSAARLRRQKTRIELDAARGRLETARAALAEVLGVPYDSLRSVRVDSDGLKALAPKSLSSKTVQQAALFNRLDIRKGLADYAASEAALRGAIARQYPDLTLSPGFAWDQSDKIWSLGAALLLPVFNLNEGPIAEARARRELEAARFTAVQARVLAGLARARTDYVGRFKALQTAQSLIAEQQALLQGVERRFDIGATDRLNMDVARLELVAAERARLEAFIAAQLAFGRLEDAVQQPLDGSVALGDDFTSIYGIKGDNSGETGTSP